MVPAVVTRWKALENSYYHPIGILLQGTTIFRRIPLVFRRETDRFPLVSCAFSVGSVTIPVVGTIDLGSRDSYSFHPVVRRN